MKSLDIIFDIERLREATAIAYDRLAEFNNEYYVSFVHRPEDTDWADQILGPREGRWKGTFLDRKKNRLYYESEFTEFNEAFKDTYFYEVWNSLREVVDKPLGRMRLMRLLPRSCLSFHRDFEVRYHLPIVTNPRSFFVLNDTPEDFPEIFDTRAPTLGIHHLPATGRVYWFDTTRYHTVFNGGKTERIHLVISEGQDSPNVDLERA